jgi:hypothetical protein
MEDKPQRVTRKGFPFAMAIVASGLVAAGAGSAGAQAPAGKKITCRVQLTALRFPSAKKPGVDYGMVSCPGPFGKGVQYDTFTFEPRTRTTGLATLTFKAYFDTGTVSGVWHASYGPSGKFNKFVQKIRWNSGTGAFTHVRGSGKGIGFQTGNHSIATQTITVTGS